MLILLLVKIDCFIVFLCCRHGKCLIETFTSETLPDMTYSLPGLVYDADDQCYMSFKTRSCDEVRL